MSLKEPLGKRIEVGDFLQQDVMDVVPPNFPLASFSKPPGVVWSDVVTFAYEPEPEGKGKITLSLQFALPHLCFKNDFLLVDVEILAVYSTDCPFI